MIRTGSLQIKSTDPEADQRLSTIVRLIQESTFGLKEVLHTTAPCICKSQSLLARLHDLTHSMLHDIEHTLTIDEALSTAFSDPSVRKNTLMFYKEALHNAVRHAQCTHIGITMQSTPDGCLLCISDNGQGLTEQQLDDEKNLCTLKLRARDLHSTLQVKSNPDTGTKISILFNAL